MVVGRGLEGVVRGRGGWYLRYIVKPQYSGVTIPVLSKRLGNNIIAVSRLPQY